MTEDTGGGFTMIICLFIIPLIIAIVLMVGTSSPRKNKKDDKIK